MPFWKLHAEYNQRAWFDNNCADLRIPLAMAPLTAIVAFKIARFRVTYKRSNGESPNDSSSSILVIAVLTCVIAIALLHAMP